MVGFSRFAACGLMVALMIPAVASSSPLNATVSDETVTEPINQPLGCQAELNPIQGCELWSDRPLPRHPFSVLQTLAATTDADGTRVYELLHEYNGGILPSTPVVRALDSRNGDLSWTWRPTAPEPVEVLGREIETSPDGSLVYFYGRTSQDRDSSTGWLDESDFAAHVVALDAVTGALQWERFFDTEGPTRMTVPRGLAVTESVVVVAGGARELDTPDDPDMENQDMVAVGLDPTDGETLWSFRYDGPANSFDRALDVGVSPDGSRFFLTGISLGLDVAGPNNYASIVGLAIDVSSLSVAWEYRLPSQEAGWWTAGIFRGLLDSGRLYIVGHYQVSNWTRRTDYPVALALDAATGDLVWQNLQANLGASLTISPALGGNALVVSGRLNGATHISAVDAASGIVLWERNQVIADFNDARVGVSRDANVLYMSSRTENAVSSAAGFEEPLSSQAILTEQVSVVNGETLWSAKFGIETESRRFRPISVVVDGSGQVTVVAMGGLWLEGWSPWAFAYAPTPEARLALEPSFELHCKVQTNGNAQAKCNEDVDPPTNTL